MFLAILRYKVPPEKIEPYRKGHIEFLKAGYANNDFIVSGRMLTGKGGVILSPLTQRGQFEQLLSNDPFKINNLADYEIIAFEPSRFHPDFSSFVREPVREKIELVPYAQEWDTLFKAEAERIKGALGDTFLVIHHIGSTSIPGIVAKPIIDILPVVKDIHVVDQLTPLLETLGYEGRGEFGIPGRRLFVKSENGKRTFNVHIFEDGHPDIERHLRFRDYLKNHQDDADAYSKLKIDLVKLSPDDMERYSWGKEDFVKAIELKAMLWR